MVQVQNEYITKIIRDGAKLTLSEGVPDNMLSNIHVVFDATPDFHRQAVLLGTGADTTTGTISVAMPAASRNTRIFVTGLSASYVKNATADTATGVMSISVNVGGVAQQLHRFAVLTLTAQSESIYINFPVPIEITAGSNATFSGDFTVGAMSRVFCIHGYEVPK